MATPLSSDALRDALGEGQDDVIDRWMEASQRHCWQLRNSTNRPQLRERAAAALLALVEAVRSTDTLALGEPIFREPIQLFSFLAGWMVGEDLPISAAVALCQGLRDVTGPEPRYLHDSLIVVVAEAYAAGIEQTAQARHRLVIEKSQVVCVVRERVVCLFLVGDPDREALDDAVGRLMMLAVMRDATAIVIDSSALVDCDQALSLALGFVAEHREALANRRILLTAVGSDTAAELAQQVELPLVAFERLDFGLRSLD